MALNTIKRNKVQYGSIIYWSANENEVDVTFEDAAFDFDALDQTFKLFGYVAPKYILTRGLCAPKSKMRAVLAQARFNVETLETLVSMDLLKRETHRDLQRLNKDLAALLLIMDTKVL